MGIFSVFKQLKNAASAGGNFGFVAQNIATLYYAIGETPFGKTLDDETRLFATGILDIIAYLNDGTLSPDSVVDSISYGKIGQVSLDFYSIQHRRMFDVEDNGVLIGFAMQLEAFIFEASNTGIGYRDIVDQVVSHKSVIANMISKTLAEGKRSPLYPSVMGNVSIWLSDPNIIGLINSYQAMNKHEE